MESKSDKLLVAENVNLKFSGLSVLKDVSFEVREQQVVSIIGPNGAGKTSLLNCISGFYKFNSGSIRFNGHEIGGLTPHEVTRKGVARAFQNIELFYGLTVAGNLMLSRHKNLKYSLLESILYTGKVRDAEAQNRYEVEKVIDFMELENYRNTLVGNLSYGIRKRVEVARALCLKPSLILLDEPMAGMNSGEKEDIVRFIMEMRDFLNITVVLIEHDLGVVMDISDNIIVLNFGEMIASGNPETVSADPKVIEAYIGGEKPVTSAGNVSANT